MTTTDQQPAAPDAPPADAPAPTGSDEMVVLIPANAPTTEPQALGTGEQVPGLYLPGEAVSLGTLALRMGLPIDEARRRLVDLGIAGVSAGEPPVAPDVTTLSPVPPPVLPTSPLPEGATDARDSGEAISAEMADDPMIQRQAAPDMVEAGAFVAQPLPVGPQPDQTTTGTDATVNIQLTPTDQTTATGDQTVTTTDQAAPAPAPDQTAAPAPAPAQPPPTGGMTATPSQEG